MSFTIWLIPVRASRAQLRSTLRVLGQFAVGPIAVTPEKVLRGWHDASPTAAVLHGGRTGGLMVTALRTFGELGAPTMAVVEGLTDHVQSFLLDLGAHDQRQVAQRPC